LTGRDQDLAGIELNEPERIAFLHGAALQLGGRAAPYGMGAIFPDVERLAETRREKITRVRKKENLSKAEKFFAALETKPSVVRSPSGLRYEIVARGSGPVPKPQQTLTVHYTGRLIDG